MEPQTHHLAWLLLCVLCVSSSSMAANADGACTLRKVAWNPSALARFGLSISLRKSDRASPQGCGMISQESLQMYVAAQWVCERLNADFGNGSFVPGVQFGFDLLDDCRSSTRAVRYALDYVESYSDSLCHLSDAYDNTTTTTITTSSPAAGGGGGGGSVAEAASTVLKIGLVGPTRSSTAEETADSMRSIGLPIVSPSATLASLTQGDTPHPNFFRTVPSDKLQIKTIVAILKQLRWTYLVVVYTDDNYGEAGSRMLRAEARASNVCVNDTIAIHSHTPMVSVVSQLVRTRQNTEGGTMAVVYIGQKDKAENLIFNVRSLAAFGFHFILSDSVSTNTDVFDSGRLDSGANIALGSLTLAPSSVILRDFEAYLNRKYRDVKEGRVQDDVIKSYLKDSGLLQSADPLPAVKQISFVPLEVGAIFALAEATQQAHADRCAGAGATGVCPALLAAVREGDILKRVKTLQVNFGAMDGRRAPPEFKSANYVLEFDPNGDVVPKSELPDYTVLAYSADNKKPFDRVGAYSGGALTLNMAPVRMLDKRGQVTSQLPTSVCAGSCAECADNGKISMAYVNGSAYIIGVFSMHERNAEQPFKCGDFRNVSHDAVVLEAFLHAVEQLKKKTGINFGAVAFDDCYSSLHITSILSDFLSGLVPYDKGLFEVCVPQDHVVGVVGSLSSDSTLAVASFNSPQRIPTISYAASSPDLDDTINYPYFLRTVPSDVEQAIAMTELIKAMGWEYVGLLYVSNNYGTKGAQAFKQVANERGVCVAKPVPITVNPTNVDEKQLYDAFVTLMQQSVKVVVFFGIDTRMADFLRLIESRNEQGSLVFIASEEWGTKDDVLAAGKKAARGSITFKVDNTYIDPTIEGTLRTRLLEKRPREDDVNPWFSEFWQHIFDCNIPGGFNNIFSRNCDQNTRLSTQQVDSMLSDQRVKHVMNAVQAMASGLAQAGSQICEDAFPCPFLRSHKYATEVYDAIKSQTVTFGSNKQQLFDHNGNGNIGFSIYNIQKQGENYNYNKVGTYSKKSGLEITKKNIRFYSDIGESSAQVAAQCTGDLCSAPECSKTPEVRPTPAPEVTTDKEFRVADMVILIVLVVLCLLLICCMFWGFKYFRQKVRGLSKDLLESKNENIYHMVSTPRQPTYGNVDSAAQRMLSLPLPLPSSTSSMPFSGIQFVNASCSTASNSPGNTLDGRTNPAFVPDNTRTTPSASESSLTPTHRRRGSPPPPPPPNRSPAPPFHHSMSAMPRLQQEDVSNGSDRASAPHKYYMTHSLSSQRELPALPGGGAQSSSRSFRSFQSCPAESQERMEDIPMTDLSPGFAPSHASAPQQQADSPYLHASESDLSLNGEIPLPQDEGSIQYFRMTPSGQLEEEEEKGHSDMLNAYSLSPPEDEDRSTLDTYSLTPQLTRAAYQQHGSPSVHSREIPPRERSDSSPPTQYAGTVPAQERSDTPNAFPGFIRPLRVTPEMRDMILQQILLDTIQSAQRGGEGYHGMHPGPGPASVASSANSAASPGRHPPDSGNYPPQRSHPGSYPSSEVSAAAPPRPSVPWNGQALSHAPAAAPVGGPSAQSVQTGVYTPFLQLPQYSLEAQPTPLPGLPQTVLASSPYAQLAQGASAPQLSSRAPDTSQPTATGAQSRIGSSQPVSLEQISPQLSPQQQHVQQTPPPPPQRQERQQEQQEQPPPAVQMGDDSNLWMANLNYSTV
ncbi:hypothetical protein ACOMHN_028083 [Nucella lapillus]